MAKDFGPGRETTILVVEDEALMRALAAHRLQEHGYKVIEAGPADEAISVLSHGAGIDLVFSDVSLPGALGGLALALWLHNHQSDIALLLTSGVPPTVSVLREERVAPFLAKPYDLDELVKRVSQLLEMRTKRPRAN
jgi:DNA-binding NtrC family response regulator